MNKKAGKKRAAEAALTHVVSGMTLGLGTGSTAEIFVALLGEKAAQGWSLSAVPTSEATHRQAANLGIEIIVPDETTTIDLAIDGTDEADPKLNLIKGGGGALLREKIVAIAAKKFIVIADKTKHVAALGAFPLPVEIEPFGWALTVQALRETFTNTGFDTPTLTLRAEEGTPFASDGGNLIVDCALDRIEHPAKLESALIAIPGVVETGLFCGIADMVIYGGEDGVSIDKG